MSIIASLHVLFSTAKVRYKTRRCQGASSNDMIRQRLKPPSLKMIPSVPFHLRHWMSQNPLGLTLGVIILFYLSIHDKPLARASRYYALPSLP